MNTLLFEAETTHKIADFWISSSNEIVDTPCVCVCVPGNSRWWNFTQHLMQKKMMMKTPGKVTE
jgi:hypothetical protein